MQKNKTFLVRFDAQIIIDGQILLQANSQKEAEKLAKSIIPKVLNKEDCIIELDNNITIRAIEVFGTSYSINITDSMVLES